MSIYYLNLDHPQLPVRQGKQERGLVVYAVKGPQKYDLVEAALPSTVQLAGVDNQVKEMLYHRLASHASQLLTALWSDPK